MTAINRIKNELVLAIQADIENLDNCEYLLDKAFYQGRIFARSYDLEVINQILNEIDGERKETS